MDVLMVMDLRTLSCLGLGHPHRNFTIVEEQRGGMFHRGGVYMLIVASFLRGL